jgi:hypothetical protein
VNRDPDERAQPDGAPADDEFEAIVAGWRREGRVPTWPEERGPAALFDPGPAEPGLGEPGLFSPSAPRAASPPPEEEHFIPPEPPPLPPIGPPALVGLALVGAGLLLLVSPGLLGVSQAYGLPLGLVGIAAGLGWLVLRLWPDAPESEDGSRPDDGAIL